MGSNFNDLGVTELEVYVVTLGCTAVVTSTLAFRDLADKYRKIPVTRPGVLRNREIEI